MRLLGFTRYMLIYTRAADAGYLFFPFEGPVDAADLASGRASISIYGLSGTNMEAKVGWQLSDDSHAWPTPATTDGTFTLAAQTGDGIVYGTVYDDLSAVTKKYMRFGVRTKNTAATPTVPCFALVAIRIELKKV